MNADNVKTQLERALGQDHANLLFAQNQELITKLCLNVNNPEQVNQAIAQIQDERVRSAFMHAAIDFLGETTTLTHLGRKNQYIEPRLEMLIEHTLFDIQFWKRTILNSLTGPPRLPLENLYNSTVSQVYARLYENQAMLYGVTGDRTSFKYALKAIEHNLHYTGAATEETIESEEAAPQLREWAERRVLNAWGSAVR